MKRRTVIAARVYLVLTLIQFAIYLAFFGMIVASRASVSSEIRTRLLITFALSFEWILWSGLVRRQKWGWTGLIVLNVIAILNLLGQAAYAIHYHQKVHPLPEWIGFSISTLVLIVIPLWILLTDKPSRWIEETEAQDITLYKLHDKAEAASAALDGIIAPEKPIERYETWTQENNQNNSSHSPESSDSES